MNYSLPFSVNTKSECVFLYLSHLLRHCTSPIQFFFGLFLEASSETFNVATEDGSIKERATEDGPIKERATPERFRTAHPDNL